MTKPYSEAYGLATGLASFVWFDGSELLIASARSVWPRKLQ